MRMIRQGDVLVIEVDAIPEGTRPVPRDAGRVVLAYGEVTGHAHAILDEGAELVETTDEEHRRFLRIVSGVTVTVRHEEHGPIAIAPGTYEVRRQREWSDADEPVLVAD